MENYIPPFMAKSQPMQPLIYTASTSTGRSSPNSAPPNLVAEKSSGWSLHKWTLEYTLHNDHSIDMCLDGAEKFIKLDSGGAGVGVA